MKRRLAGPESAHRLGRSESDWLERAVFGRKLNGLRVDRRIYDDVVQPL